MLFPEVGTIVVIKCFGCQMVLNLENVVKNHCFAKNSPTFLTLNFAIFYIQVASIVKTIHFRLLIKRIPKL